MKISTSSVLFLLLSISSAVLSMELGQQGKVHQVQRINDFVALLPQLTIHEEWAMPSHLSASSTSLVELQKEIAYQAALKNEDPIKLLKQVALPHVFQLPVQQIPDRGNVLMGSGKLQYPLAHLARAFLLQQCGNADEAEQAFKETIQAIDMYRSHEEPILSTALFAQSFFKQEYEAAFNENKRLQLLSKAYASFKPVAALERQMLVDAQYLPALEQCAQENTPESWQSLRSVAQHGTVTTRCFVAQQELASKNKKSVQKVCDLQKGLLKNI